jgi:hypothetical protein
MADLNLCSTLSFKPLLEVAGSKSSGIYEITFKIFIVNRLRLTVYKNTFFLR